MELLLISEENTFRCDLCICDFPTKSALVEHEKSHAPDRKVNKTRAPEWKANKSHAPEWKLDKIHDAERPYVCNYCNKTFGKKFILTLHIRSHTGEKPYACDTCGKRFPQKSDLTRHQRVHSGEKPFRCDICLKLFNQKPALTQHRRIHTGEKPFSCKVCHRRFNKKASVVQHCCEVPAKTIEQSADGGPPRESIITIKTKPFTCRMCPKQFSTKFCLIEHEKVHQSGKLYVCEICNKDFAYKSSFMKHDSTHLEGKLIHCDFCFKLFANTLALEIHTCIKPDYVLPDELPYLSDVIIESYNETDSLQEPEQLEAYENTELNIEDKPYVCHICRKSFKRKYILSIHLRSHTGEKPYECDECEKKFPQKSDLVRHKRIHSGEKPYACDFCPKRFAQKPGMTQHRRTHTGEKPFKCKICFKTFNKKASVIEHCCVVPGSKKPLKLKPFACGIGNCKKLFSTKFGVALHRRLHVSGDFTCTVCGKSFSYQTTLSKHLQSHMQEREYYCTICDEVFTDKSLYILHRRTHRNRNKPFKCSECHQSFKLKYSLEYHKCEKSGNWFPCHMCHEICDSKYNLKRHMQLIHGKEVSCIKCHAVIEDLTGNVCDACKKSNIYKANQNSEDTVLELFDESSYDSYEEASDSLFDLIQTSINNSNFQILASESVKAYEEQFGFDKDVFSHSPNVEVLAGIGADSNVENSLFESKRKDLDSPNLQILAGACVQYSLSDNGLNSCEKNLQILAGASALRQIKMELYST